jgi:hypothetical protein
LAQTKTATKAKVDPAPKE